VAPTRWPALDGVRGLAVISVVVYHAIRLLVLGEGRETADAFSAAWWPVMTGRLALDAFFVLSGFLIVESWHAIRRRDDSVIRAARGFARKRAARILPAYWVSLVVLVPLVAPHLFRSPGDLALLAGVQQYLRPGLPSEVNVVYWSLTTEVHFYALAPLIGLALRRFGVRDVVIASLVVAVVWQATTPLGLAQSLAPGRVDQFVLGAALAGVVRAWSDGHHRRVIDLVRRRGMGWVLVSLLLALGVWQGAILDGHAAALSALLHPLVGVVMAGLLLRVLTSERRSFLEAPALRLAGLVSYGVYLFHYPVLEYGLRWAGLGPSAPHPAYLSIAVAGALTVASFVVGGLSYVIVERPFVVRKGPPRESAPEPTFAAWPMSTATSTTSSANSA
jgi:peptidoglycan/LPS O-acetylase OafA/YrhL